jgi:hypothetical protein
LLGAPVQPWNAHHTTGERQRIVCGVIEQHGTSLLWGSGLSECRISVKVRRTTEVHCCGHFPVWLRLLGSMLYFWGNV